jgi:hypothetical protein
VLALEALPEVLFDLVLDLAVLPLHVGVRSVRHDADRRAPQLGTDDFVEVVCPDLGVEEV